jgi:hypothetical protein
MKTLPFQAAEMAVHNPRMKFATLLVRGISFYKLLIIKNQYISTSGVLRICP